MQMKAAVLVAPGRFEIQSRPVPEPQRGEVLIKISRVGICGTDIHIFNGHYAADSLPMVPGHEFTGRVAASGTDANRLRAGQKVVVDMNIGCGVCYWCRRQEVLNCPDMNQIGITVDGAFCEYICVPEHLVIPAPDHIADEVLALTEPLACVVRAARKSRITFGQSVVVIGAGPIGNLHVQLLRTIGAAPIIVADLAGERVDMAISVGADVGVADPETLHAAVMQATDGRGADIVIESVGNPYLYRLATTLIRKGGHIAAFGLTGAGAELPLDILSTILQENSIKGSVAGIGQDMHDALTLLVHNRIDHRPLTSAVFDLADIQAAFDTLQHRPGDLKTQINISRE
tara:strand:- start:10377 stop:11411 length:1035 start_codon:yes stop_codon:yes gene_type:complete